MLTLARRSLRPTFRPWQRLAHRQAYLREFTPNWFTANMGTGIVFLILLALPWQWPGQHALALVLWLLDMAMFAAFSVMFVGRLLRHRDTVMPLLRHPVQSMFLGAIPMGLIPIVNGMVLFGLPWFGQAALSVAQALWWFDAALAVFVAVLVPFMMFTRQEHALERITPVWLLPIVGPEVTASSAGVLAPHLGAGAAQLMVSTGYVLWAISVPLAMCIITVIIFRMALHKLPPADMAASTWLPLGPIGTGSLGLLVLGQAAVHAFAAGPLAEAASLVRSLGLLGGLVMWGMGAWWVAIAGSSTLRYVRQGINFNLGWWGFTFPLGVYTAATLTLGRLTGFVVFNLIGLGLALSLFAIWGLVARRTAHALWHGHLFHAPCLHQPAAPVAEPAPR